jgi:hypothetical protein
MNIDDMGDNTRVPDQPSACHYWPDCPCGPDTKCGIKYAEAPEIRQAVAFLMVMTLVAFTACVAVGVVLAIGKIASAIQ